jgi:hypothetical protein
VSRPLDEDRIEAYLGCDGLHLFEGDPPAEFSFRAGRLGQLGRFRQNEREFSFGVTLAPIGDDAPP